MATMQGVYITILGMAILFAALLILMLAAMGLERLFRPKELEEVLVQPKNEEASSEREKELVAAIAVATLLKLKAQSSKLKLQTSNLKPQTSERVLSAWKFWGRYRQLMSSREVRGYRE